MLFSCHVVLLAADDEFKVLSDYSNLEFQILPVEKQFILFKPSISNQFLVRVETILPIIDAEHGIAARFFISLRIVKPAPKFVNIVDLGNTPTS